MSIQVGEIVMYTVEEISEMLQLSTQSVKKYLNQKKIIGKKIGVRWFVSEENLKNFLSDTAS